MYRLVRVQYLENFVSGIEMVPDRVSRGWGIGELCDQRNIISARSTTGDVEVIWTFEEKRPFEGMISLIEGWDISL